MAAGLQRAARTRKKGINEFLFRATAAMLALEEMPFHERWVENFRQIELSSGLSDPGSTCGPLNYSNFSPLHSIPLSRRWSESHCVQVASNAGKHRFDNYQSLNNLRIKSEFLTMSELRNRLVLTLLEQDLFCRCTRTSATLTDFSAAINPHTFITVTKREVYTLVSNDGTACANVLVFLITIENIEPI